MEVFATAKALAVPEPISVRHLLLALEAGDTVAARTLKKLNLRPSTIFGRTPPAGLSAEGDLFLEDFELDLRRDLQRLAVAEAKSMGWMYLGTDALLLLVARLGATEVDLPYERVRVIFCKYAHPA